MPKDKLIEEALKKKDWSLQQWKDSEDELDRTVWFIGSLSPHNYWKGREALTKLKRETEKEVVERIKNKLKKNLESWLADTPHKVVYEPKSPDELYVVSADYKKLARQIIKKLGA